MKVAKQTLETSLLFELDKKDRPFFFEVHARPDVLWLDKKLNFCVEVVPHGKRKILDYKTDSVKKILRISWKMWVSKSFANCKKLKRNNSGIWSSALYSETRKWWW